MVYRLSTSPPKKFYKGKKRLALPFVKRFKKYFEWAVSVKPGDYINTFETSNRKVVRIEYTWANEGEFRRCKINKTWYLDEVHFICTNGKTYVGDGYNGPEPAWSPEDIRKYHAGFSEELKKEWGFKFHEVDEFGEFIE